MKILAIRFSALGDVAMTIPVVVAFCNAHPEVDVTFLTSGVGSKVYRTVTSDVKNLTVKAVNLKKDYKGIGGLNRLYAELSQEHFDAVADLHDVLRTKWLRLRFKLSGIKVAKIDKGRKEKKRLTSGSEKHQLKSGFERYHEVFRKLGFNFALTYDPRRSSLMIKNRISEYAVCEQSAKVGIAPFAQHRGKIYPKPRMQEVISLLLGSRQDLTIYLFGGPDEASELDQWTHACPERIINLAGKQSIDMDICTMSALDCMISMDSSNMHLASLVGLPVVSIWGATHPYAGFLGYGQSITNAVMLPLPCRPCSIYGNKPCRFGTWECMESINPAIIAERVTSVLGTGSPTA